jgi:hypothetical protein
MPNPNKFKPKGNKPDAQDDIAATNEDTPALILIFDNDSERNCNDEILIPPAGTDTVSAVNLLDSSITSDVDQNDVLSINDLVQTDGPDTEFEVVRPGHQGHRSSKKR